MGAEDFAAARRDDALAGHAAVAVITVMTPPFMIAWANAGLERADPHANVLGSGRGHDGKRCNCRQSKHKCPHDILLFQVVRGAWAKRPRSGIGSYWPRRMLPPA